MLSSLHPNFMSMESVRNVHFRDDFPEAHYLKLSVPTLFKILLTPFSINFISVQ